VLKIDIPLCISLSLCGCQIDAVSLFLLYLVEMICSGLQIIYNTDEVSVLLSMAPVLSNLKAHTSLYGPPPVHRMETKMTFTFPPCCLNSDLHATLVRHVVLPAILPQLRQVILCEKVII